MTELTLKQLRAANALRQTEWDRDGKIDLTYRGCELAGEAGEACNVVKKLERERRGIRGSRSTPARLAEELADVIICADLIALDVGIDLGAAVVEKFNKTSEENSLATRLRALPFSKGDEVICIDHARTDGCLVEGEVYAVVDVLHDTFKVHRRGFYLPVSGWWSAKHFRAMGCARGGLTCQHCGGSGWVKARGFAGAENVMPCGEAA